LLNRWKFFEGCKKILDAGCGSGDFMKLNPYKMKIIGRDVDKQKLESLKKEGFEVDFANLNKELSFEENLFDGIACFNVLEHLEDPSLTIREFYRVLNKGGKLFLIVPNLPFRDFYNDYTHRRLFTKLSLYNILKDNGFTNIKIKNGPTLQSQIINSSLLLFPRFRLQAELFMGNVFPSEFFAFAQK
jgi:SAM-dependent methyltransferase